MLIALGANSARALKSDDDTLVEGAKLCTRYLPRHERQYGIPEHLLAAIASTESGRYHRALGLNLPWPWTINVEGMGHFYDTKQDAIDAVKSYQARGFASIDVGCMQVNLLHHPNAFATLDEAFDPAYNVGYAAQFLKQNFQDEGNWHKATADYHSHTPMYGEQYAHLVYGAWSRIINKVADARAGRPILNAKASSSYTSSSMHAHNGYHGMRMHSMSLARGPGRDTTRENGVIVIRPDYSSDPARVQQASVENDFVTHIKSPASNADKPAASPDNMAVASADEASHSPQIVKVRSDGVVSNNRGQFEPSSHVARSGGDGLVTNVSGGSGVASGGESAKSPFIFNN